MLNHALDKIVSEYFYLVITADGWLWLDFSEPTDLETHTPFMIHFGGREA